VRGSIPFYLGGATGLEWRIPSPPPAHNFEKTPVVTWAAYEYRPFEEEQLADDRPAGERLDRSSYTGE
jgi:heme/copper-type cytochrome/quinol oxidase subunit 1